jgi:hypothetical protein
MVLGAVILKSMALTSTLHLVRVFFRVFLHGGHHMVRQCKLLVQISFPLLIKLLMPSKEPHSHDLI